MMPGRRYRRLLILRRAGSLFAPMSESPDDHSHSEAPALSISDLSTLIHYQTSLFTALVGVLSANDLVMPRDVGAALEIVADTEVDLRARQLLKLLSAALLNQEFVPSAEFGRFSVIPGGRTD